MDYVKALRRMELVLYTLALTLTTVLAGVAFYLVVERIIGLFNSSDPYAMSQKIFIALSDLFLFIIFIELLDTLITYIQHKEIIVYKIIDVALVALARELFIYVSPTAHHHFDAGMAAALIAAVLVVGFVDYLQRRARA